MGWMELEDKKLYGVGDQWAGWNYRIRRCMGSVISGLDGIIG